MGKEMQLLQDLVNCIFLEDAQPSESDYMLR